MQFMLILYNCSTATKEKTVGNTINGYPLITADSKVKRFTRSSNINQLRLMVRPTARFLVVDIDMRMTDMILENVLKYVKPGVAYFPIVWSKYSPRHIERVQRELHYKILRFTDQDGSWRIHGYGMYAMHANDLLRFPLDESFVGWGGEDNEFYKRVKNDPSMQVVRLEEKGLIHIWHDKNCSQIISDPHKKVSCLGSRAAYLGSPLSMMLLMEDAIERAKFSYAPALNYAPRILVAIPTSLAFIRLRLPGIMETWGRDLPANIALKFFVSEAVGSKAQQLVSSLGYFAEFVAIDADDTEYPPVKRNVAMLLEASALIDRFDWILKVDDDTYVDIIRLQQLAYDLRDIASGPRFLGGRGFGRPSDKPHLELPTSGFCMGGPGYLLSKKALTTVMPHLQSCQDYFDRHEKRAYFWHSDVIISKCMNYWVGAECWDKESEKILPYKSNYFRQLYPKSTQVFDTVTFHPLKSYEEMTKYAQQKQAKDVKLKDTM